ncbi:MAG: efflux RND transporter permease subunit [Pseudomonadota bacterium]
MWRSVFYKTPRLVVLALFLAVAGAVGALATLGRQEDPTLVERYGYVLATLPGADAERVEALVSIPIEERLKSLPEIAEIDSSSRANVAQIGLEIADDLSESEVDDAWTLIRNQVRQADAELPDDARIVEISRQYVGASTLLVALVWKGEGPPQLAVLSRLARDLENRLQNVSGSDETDIYGLPQEEIRVIVDPDALAAAGLSTREAARRIAAADAKAPAGQVRPNGSSLGLEIGGEFDSIARISAAPLIQESSGEAVLVRDVARVEKGVEDPVTSLNLHNTERSVLVSVFVQPGLRVDQWAARARAEVDAFAALAPADIGVDIVFDQSEYTSSRLEGLGETLGYSALIVVIVLFVVMGWRAAIVCGLALPLTICLVLILFNLFDMPLHQMSVTGLIISLGLLIDNAIVVVDEFDQKRAQGYGRIEAIDASLKHLAAPLFASTLTTALAFAPIALQPGATGEFIGMIGVSVIFAVVSSFVLSMTILPALAGWIDMQRRPGLKRRFWRDGVVFDVISDGYRWTIGRVLAFPLLGVLIGVAPALGGFYLGLGQPVQFFPQTERDLFQVEVTLSPETSIDEAIEVAEGATQLIEAYPGVEEVNFTIGEAAPRVYYNAFNNQQGVAGFASGWVRMTSDDDVRKVVGELQEDLRASFPQARILALPFEQGPPAAAPIEFMLRGDDLRQLNEMGETYRRILASTPGVTYTTASLQLGAPKFTLRADETASAMAGRRLTELAADLNAELEGVPAGSVLEGVEEIPVRVIAGDERRGELADIRAKTFGESPGRPGAPLAALGEVTLDPDTAIITRLDGQRVNFIRAYLTPYALASPVLADFEDRLDKSGYTPPSGVRVSAGGEAENRGDAIGGLLVVAVPLLILMTGAVALVFNSFRMAFLILTGGFLAMGYGFFGLWLFNLPFGFNGIVGSIGLLGIAINGSIVVLTGLRNSVESMADDVLVQRELVVDATRHIVATTLTTMGGFAPIILEGDQFWLPLAASVAGGVAGAGLIALYFTPAVFRMMTWSRRLSPLRWRENAPLAPA